MTNFNGTKGCRSHEITILFDGQTHGKLVWVVRVLFLAEALDITAHCYTRWVAAWWIHPVSCISFVLGHAARSLRSNVPIYFDVPDVIRSWRQLRGFEEKLKEEEGTVV